MDFFNRRYFTLSRKCLWLIGQWPYDNQTARIKRNISVLVTIMSLTVVQIAKLVTSPRNINTTSDILSVEFIILICLIKFVTYTSQRDKIRYLLNSMQRHSNALTEYDQKITTEHAEMGRKYNVFITIFFCSGTSLAATTIALQPLLDIIDPSNVTHVKTQLYSAEYFVNPDKYFYPILCHMILTTATIIMTLLATDTLFMTFLYHACGMFRVASNRMEHAFDNWKEGQVWTREEHNAASRKIAAAVEYHKTATEFTDDIVSTYGPMLLTTLIPVLVNISITFYCTATSLGKLREMLFPMMLAASQMIHGLIMILPCQLLMDYSSAITIKAYSSKWYAAPFKLQALLLPIIQRGGRPSIIVAGKLIPLTLEYYTVALQTSVSYFTVMLSVA